MATQRRTPQRGSSKRKSSERKPPTLFGMELAPTRPRNKGTTASKSGGKPTPPTPPGAFKRQRGLALLMVMFLLVMATTIVVDLQYDSRVQLQLAANSRNTLQAEYLARSALQFTHLLLSFDTNFQRMKQRFKPMLNSPMIPPQVKILLNRLEIWRVVPIDCGLLKQVFGGAFGDARKEKAKDKDGDDAKTGKAPDGGKLYAFGDFQGNCKATLTDESAKINLNKIVSLKDRKEMVLRLTNLFLPIKYNPLFENARADGTNVTRSEQIAAIIDWADSNTQVENEPGTSEDSKYRYEEKGYRSKNSYYDSVQELRMVYGVDDIFFREFGKMFTVYGRGGINLNTAAPEVMSALIMSNGTPIKPFTPAVFLQPEFKQFMAALIAYRSYLGFEDLKKFTGFLANPTVLDPNLFPNAATKGLSIQPGSLPKFSWNSRGAAYVFQTKANTFRVTVEGIVGTVRRRISAVIYVEDRGARNTQYWRMH